MNDSLAESLRRVEALMTNKGGESPDSSLSFEILKRNIEDRTASIEIRRSAFSSITSRFSLEPAYSDLVLSLLENSDLVQDAINAAPPFDARIIARLRELLDDPRDSIRETAALALARKKDHATLPRMLLWARQGDQSQRKIGLSAVAFLLIPEQHLAVIESICEEGARDDADEAILVEALKLAESRVAFWRKATGEDES